LGKEAAGHYVKMVHNGIEYAIMQLISEIYEILHVGAGLDNDELHDLFREWNHGELQSYLVEITSEIFLYEDNKTGKRLLDLILDKAGAKGTGKWTSQDAMDLGVPIPNIDVAVAMRNLSALKEERQQASRLYHSSLKTIVDSKEDLAEQAMDALYFGMMISYAQGLALLRTASHELNMETPLPEVVKVWRGGCIIRSLMLNEFFNAYSNNPDLPSILLDRTIAAILTRKLPATRSLIVKSIESHISIPGLTAALSYLDGYRSAQMPTNLIQAQRDFFGAHTYQRSDQPGIFHTEWAKDA
jgi:6-phosphogluconate dehydrogenase